MANKLPYPVDVHELVHIRRVETLQRLLKRLSAVVGPAIALTLPTGYALVEFDHLDERMTFKAQLDAHRTAGYAYMHGETWRYASERLRELLIPAERAGVVRLQRVIGPDGEELARVGEMPASLTLRKTAPVIVSGTRIGQIEIESSLLPLLWHSLLALLLSTCLGGAAYLVCYRLPMRALGQTLGQLQSMFATIEHYAEETRFAYDDLQRQHRLLEERSQELMAARQRAEEADRTKSQFLANMSHELRTPLNAIIGFAEILAKTKPDARTAERSRGYAVDILASARHLLAIVNDVLDLAKVDADGIVLDLDEVEPWEAAVASCRFVKPQMEAADLRLVLQEPSAALPQVRADPTKLKQILINLLSNAVKFTPAGGTITVSAWPQAPGVVSIRVEDDGIGMEPDEIPRLLQPFQQIDNSHTRRHGGTGLGLPLAKRMAELHGGTFHIDSAPGKGTAVTITLPIAERESLAALG